MNDSEPSFLSDWFLPTTVKRAFYIAAIVGTLLCLINQWQAIVVGSVPVNWLKVILTYLVPYAVSSYATAASLSGKSRHID